jgi:hypothetical protein
LRRTINNRSGAATAFFCLVCAILSTAPADARTPEDNLERLLSAADSAAVLFGKDFRFRPEERIQWMEERNADPLGRILMTRVVARLAWDGIRISNPEKAHPGAAGLLLTLGKASVRYETKSSSRVPEDSPILRVAEIEMTARLERADSVLVDTVAVRLEDRIAGSEVEAVERGGFPAVKPEKPEAGSWLGMIVPALIVASVGWMVYSFYSIRSQ